MQLRKLETLLIAVMMTALAGCSTTSVFSKAGAVGKVIDERNDGNIAVSRDQSPAAVAVAAAAQIGPTSQPTEAEALQQVMPDLQALLFEDSEKHAELLKKLADTDPAMWADMTRRARSEVAYRNQKQLQPSQVVLAAHQNPTKQSAQKQMVTQVSHNRMASANSESSSAIVPPNAAMQSNSAVVENKFATNQPPTSLAANQASVATPQVIQNQYAAQPAATQPTKTDLPQVVPPTQKEPIRLATASVASNVVTNPNYQAKSNAVKELSWQEKLDEAIVAFEQKIADKPTSTREAYDHARLRLLKLAAERDEEALEAIPGLSTSEQNYWSKQIYALSTMMDTKQQTDRKRRASATSLHQAEALSQLRKMGTLQIRNLSFCSKIYGFGAYESIEEPKFTAGAEVSLYTEIENYHSESTEQGYHTLIGTSYRVEDQSGHLVDEGEFPVVEDYCLTQRRDFHITYGVTLPTTVYPGKYQVRVNLVDQLGDKIAEDVIPFEIVAP